MSKFKLSKGQISILVMLFVLIIDQASKLWVKTHMAIGDSYEITSWFYIYFIENNGMAYGVEIFSKLFLTIFRIVAVGGFSYMLYKCIKRKYPTGFVVAFSSIIAGAVGNLIDSIFYGRMFTDSYGRVAEVFPEGGGYAPYFYGKVVDMLYFPLFEITWPEWVPFVGGTEYLFFRPVFNIADSAIFCGAVSMLLFYRNYIGSEDNKKESK